MSYRHIVAATDLRWWEKLWVRVHQPRVIALLQALVYILLGAAGLYSLLSPPATITGAVGSVAIFLLSLFLMFAGLGVGWWSALLGIQWVERYAVISVAFSALIYGGVLLVLHVSEPGNRLLQWAFVTAVLLYQGIRWVRLRNAPYERRLYI